MARPQTTLPAPQTALPDTCELAVVGSGAGALSAAVTAAQLGLSVVVLEKEALVGGTTAWSGGWMWIPRNPLARAAGIGEDLGEVRRYLRHLLGANYDAPRLEMFLAHGPAMVDFHQRHTALRFIDGNAIPDFHGRVPGARSGGRSVCAAPFDASVLAAELSRLRPPRDILSFLGMSIGGDVRHFVRAGRAFDSFRYAAARVLRHGWQVLRHGQGTTRMAGNALAAALFKSALAAGVRVFTRHAAVGLVQEQGRVCGVRVKTPDGERVLRATRGVVLAAGGFPHDAQRQRERFVPPAAPSLPPRRATGRPRCRPTPAPACAWASRPGRRWTPRWPIPPHGRRSRWCHARVEASRTFPTCSSAASPA